MLFNSYIFILAFLPLAVLGYYGFGRLGSKAAHSFLLIASLVFCGYMNAYYAVILASGIVINYAISRFLHTLGQSPIAKIALAGGIILNAGALFYCKYLNFFLENLNTLLGRDTVLTEVILPLGISFYTFRQIAYLVDSYRGEAGDDTFLEYALFVSYFPALTQGPITLRDEFMGQLRDPSRLTARGENLANGLNRFAVGLSKKVLLADTLGKIVSVAFGGVEILTSSDVLLTMLCYSLQLYFDFSGYCDMAEGISLMLNLDLPANFNSPYKATSILDFWGRWHLTLTRFLRKYLYFPLGGSKKGAARTYLNIMIIFLISGLWHGANWTFIVWGALHGLFEVVTRLFKNGWEKMPKAVGWLITFAFLNVSWLLFRADSIGQFYIMLRKVATTESFAVSPLMLEGARLAEITHIEMLLGVNGLMNGIAWIYLAILLLLSMGIVLFGKNCREKAMRYNIWSAAGTVVMLIWPILSLSEITTFIYAQF
ncbi:MAG: MBOAT family protein [Lachnospiraceae bacterium]|nr:MBOAT family protein [Lachnospiraceae bacterium]